MAYGGSSHGGGGFRRGGGGGGGGGFRRDFGGPREMHKITCSECGNEGEVPFKPRQGTPVFCKDCFAKKSGRSSFRPDRGNEGESDGSSENETKEAA